jgi:hypothetical protein
MEKGFLFQTDFSAEEVKFEIKDGKTTINDKEFIVDRVQPINLKKKFLGRTRITPFYFLKWDKVEAANLQVIDVEVDGKMYGEIQPANMVKTLEVVFPDKAQGDILPEMLKETVDLRFLKSLKKYAADGAGGGSKFKFSRWMLFPIALALSGLGMFVLQGGRFF